MGPNAPPERLPPLPARRRLPPASQRKPPPRHRPAAIVDRRGLRQSSDTGALEGWCATAIANDPKSADQVRAGNAKAINTLKGAVMKLSAGKANPKFVDEIMKKQLGM